jgi:hypothetical protein
VRLLRFASIAVCLIVTASFVAFVVEQTKTASGHQQEAINGTSRGAGTAQSAHEGSVHRTLDEVANELTSPFAGLVSGSSSEWAIRSVKLVAALLVYGFGLGYLARVLRVRV